MNSSNVLLQDQDVMVRIMKVFNLNHPTVKPFGEGGAKEILNMKRCVMSFHRFAKIGNGVPSLFLLTGVLALQKTQKLCFWCFHLLRDVAVGNILLHILVVKHCRCTHRSSPHLKLVQEIDLVVS